MVNTLQIFSLLALSTVQIGLGNCPGANQIEDFTKEKIAGVWYIQKQLKYLQLYSKHCQTAEYTLRNDGKLNSLNYQYDIQDKKEYQTAGIVDFTSNSKGTISKSFWSILGDFQILDTDYDNYMIVYSCRSALIFHLKFAFILTREKNPSEETIDTYFSKLKSKIKSFNEKKFKKIVHDSGCVYLKD